MHNTIISLLKRYLPQNNRKKKILDAGCGTGGFLNKIKNNYEIYGFDINHEAVKFAKKRGLKNIKIGSLSKIPYKKNTFDAVVCIDVLYHQDVLNDVAAIKELARVLKKDGLLIIKVPAYDWLRGKHDKIVKTKHRYTKEELTEKILSSKLRLIKSTYLNSLLFPLILIKRFLNNLSAEEPKSDVEKINPYLNGILVCISKIEDKITEYIDLPFGLTIFAVAVKSSMDSNKKNRP